MAPNLSIVNLEPEEKTPNTKNGAPESPDPPSAPLLFADKIRGINNPDKPAEVTWTPVNIDGHETRRLMLIFQSRPCAKKIKHSSCAMCPFHANANPHIKDVNLTNQCASTVKRLKSTGIGLKEDASQISKAEEIEQFDIISSGSFFNDEEFSTTARKEILTMIASELPSIKKIVVESRAEFLDNAGHNKLHEAQELLNGIRAAKNLPPIKLEYSIGVESTDPAIRNGILHKMLDKKELEHAFELCKEGGIDYLQTYLLVKPHYISEGFAIDDAVRSAKDILDLAKKYGIKCRIALEPVFAGEATILDTLYKAGLYRPPNIWSVAEVAKRVREYIDSEKIDGIVFVGLSDEGISADRLTRGCEQCDQSVKAAITKFNGSQKVNDLQCDCANCKAKWQTNYTNERKNHPNTIRYINDNTPLTDIVEDKMETFFKWEKVPINKFSMEDLKLMQDRIIDFPFNAAPIINMEEGYVELTVFDPEKFELVLDQYYQAADRLAA